VSVPGGGLGYALPDVSRVLSSSEADVAVAVEALRRGALVAFPTETVYGLGAAARDPEAVARIYRAKRRPRGHPVIVHLAAAAALAGWVRELPAAGHRLAEVFWPGPLTLVLERAEGVPDAVTGGQPTVGLRVPDHPLALRLLRAFGDGVAAPSANRFGHVSPTTAAHVAEEFADQEVLVLDGGACRVGLESTIVDLSGRRPRLLRPGGVPREAIEAVLGEPLPLAEPLAEELEPGEAPALAAPTVRAPGGLPSHYAPVTPSELVASAALDALANGAIAGEAGVGVLARRPAPSGFAGVWMALPAEPEGFARELYAALRRLDAAGCRRILIEAAPGGPAWLAVRDRLRRATAGHGARSAPAARREGP